MRALIDTRRPGARIHRHVYGHFSEHLGRCIYGGYWVGADSPIPNVRGIRADIVEAMKAIRVPNIRWPGGCFADDYHWMDGVGPLAQRRPMVNVHWGGVLENNHFGTHEFMDLCDQIGCEAYICGNVGSGTVREMRDWVEYLTDDGQSPMAQMRRQNGRARAWNLRFFGIGNENWGCGGFMTAEQYAAEFRRYAAYVKNYAVMGKIDWWKAPPITRIAGGEDTTRPEWTETLMKSVPPMLLGGLSVHCYVKPGEETDGTSFSEKSWYQTARNTLATEERYRRHISIMDYYDPERKVLLAVDEWGIWVDNEPDTVGAFLYQQNTMRSALCAALMLHIFHKHADRIRLANLAQTINVLQAIILTDGPRMLKTPTYHVFDLFQRHQDADSIPLAWLDAPPAIEMGLPHVDVSASMAGDGTVTVTLVNLSAADSADVSLEFAGRQAVAASGRVMDGEVTAHNTFDQPDNVTTRALESVTVEERQVVVTLPPCGIASIEVTLA